MDKVRLTVVVGLTVAAVGVVGGLMILNRPEPVDPAQTPVRAQSFDQLMAQLATQTKQSLGADDFTVVVTQSTYPIGTLLRPNSTVPVDDEACVATPEPRRYDAPNFAPELKMSRQLAASVGLSDIAPIIGGSGAEVKSSDEMSLSFLQPGYRILTDNALAKILTSQACRDALSDEPRWLVRGYVLARRKLLLTNARDNSIKADIEKVSTFKVTPVGKSEVSLVDDRETPFLQLVSVVQRPKASAAAAAPPAFIAPSATPVAPPPSATPSPTPVQVKGMVYVQRDATDRTRRPSSAVAALEAAAFRVAGAIEAIPTAKMPKTPQVRYFNGADLPVAQRAAAIVGQSYPGTQVLEVKIPAPAGQLEVWLPAAGAPAITAKTLARTPMLSARPVADPPRAATLPAR